MTQREKCASSQNTGNAPQDLRLVETRSSNCAPSTLVIRTNKPVSRQRFNSSRVHGWVTEWPKVGRHAPKGGDHPQQCYEGSNPSPATTFVLLAMTDTCATCRFYVPHTGSGTGRLGTKQCANILAAASVGGSIRPDFGCRYHEPTQAKPVRYHRSHEQRGDPEATTYEKAG